jgi:hypothetical protein
MNKIKKIWKTRKEIISGIWNYIFASAKNRKIAKMRMEICKSNRCGYFDASGTGENTFIKGSAACGICGCNSEIMTNSMETKCSLQELGQEPLW